MSELVQWLIGLEESAADAYALAATLFTEKPSLQALLLELEKDERSHGTALNRAKAFIESLDDFPPVVSFDEESKWDIEAPLIEFRTRLEDGKMSEKELINFMLVIEYSELNELFLSVLNAVKERSEGSIDILENIEDHKDRIESYLASRPGFEGYIKRIKVLTGGPRDMRLLIVDDTESNLKMLKAIFEGKFAVETANNGAEAFEKLSTGNYAAVISDVDMPVMDGLEFYMKAREIIPGINGRFIFYSASLDVKHISFFNENRIKYLVKPASIKNIRDAVMKIAS